MAPLGSGWKIGRDVERYPRPADEPQSPKCGPALFPHPRMFTGKNDKGFEVSREALERTVTPEAHEYFRRMVQTTQSELERLLVYKIQQLFDPVSPMTVAEIAKEDIPPSLATTVQLPGASAAAHLSALEGRRGPTSLRHQCAKERAANEGRDLTKHLVGILGQVLADFGCFADAILRWQTENRDDNTYLSDSDLLSGAQGKESGWNGLLGRLEQQNRENAFLEARNAEISAELRENRRDFMREREMWREQKSQAKSAVRSKARPAVVLEILDRQVQFFGGDFNSAGEDVEELKIRYEQVIAELKAEHDDVNAEMADEIAQLKARVNDLVERMEEMAKMAKMRKQSSDSIFPEPEVVLVEKDTTHLDSLISQLREESDSLLQELTTSQAANAALASELSTMQAQLQEALSRPLVESPTVAQYVQAPMPVQREMASQVSGKDWAGCLKRESPSYLTIDFLPTEDESSSLRNELAASRAEAQRLEDQMAKDRELSEILLGEAVRDAERKASDATKALANLQQEIKEKQAAWELAEKQMAMQLERASTERPCPACVAVAVQTDAWEPQPASDGVAEQALRQRVADLETSDKRNKTLLLAAHTTIAELQDEISALKRKIQVLEDNAKENSRVVAAPLATVKRRTMGGGWKNARPKVSQCQRLVATLSVSDNRGQVVPQEFKPLPGECAPSSSRGVTTLQEEKQYRIDQSFEDQEAMGSVLDFRPCRGRGSDSLCVKMLEESPGEQVGLADVEWQAIPSVSMPVSGYAVLPDVLPGSTTAVIPPEVRSSYGGGFSVLESTAWKGADRSDIQPSGDRASALLPCEMEQNQPSSSVPLPAVIGGGASSSLSQQLRPSSGQKTPHSLTQSVSNYLPSTTAAASAVKVRRSPPGDRLLPSSSSPQLRHPVLHGPSKRGRPHSAASPLQGRSVQSSQDASRRKHGTSCYGSAIFDG